MPCALALARTRTLPSPSLALPSPRRGPRDRLGGPAGCLAAVGRTPCAPAGARLGTARPPRLCRLRSVRLVRYSSRVRAAPKVADAGGDRTDDKTAIYSVLPHASPPSLPLPVRFLFADRRRGRRVRVVRLNALRGAAAWRLGENRRSVRTDAGRAPQSRVDLLPTRHGFWGRAIRTTTTTTTTMTTTTTRVLSRPTAGRAPAVPPEPGNDSILARDRLVVRGRATWCSASPAR